MDTINTTPLSDDELLETGRIVVRTGEIENRLTELGGSGSGLREKSDSVSGLSAEIREQLAFIGAIRNRVAHEGGATVSPEELQRFHEAVDTVLAVLAVPQKNAQKPDPKPRTKPKSKPAAVPPPKSFDTPLAVVPLAHLVFGLQRLFDGVFPSGVPLLLLFLELASLPLIRAGYRLDSIPMTLCGVGLLAGCVGAGVLDAVRFPPETRAAAWLVWTPLLNLLYFLRRILQTLAYLAFLEGAAILGTWSAAIVLAARGEWLAAALLAVVSYGASALVWFYSRTGVA